MTASPNRPAGRRYARLAVPAIALLALCALAACGNSVSATGSGGLNGTDASAAPSSAPATPTTPASTHTKPPAPHPSTVTTAPGSGSPTIIIRLPHFPLEDCITYDPAAAAVVNLGADGYSITAGSASLLLVDNATDASTALALVQHYSKQCFAGRSNAFTGNDHYRHIVQYWSGTGVAGSLLPTPDCIGYDNTALAVNNLGADGYQLVAGSNALALTGSLGDANRAKSVATAYHHLCFIGRGNARTERNRYIVEYWS